MNVSVGASCVTDANQYQHRVKRNRRERIRGHALHFAVVINRDDGDAGREAPHRVPEFVLSSAHS